MRDDDFTLNDTGTSASGILECLRMLAEEAADLHLDDTLRALHQAIAVCETEGNHGEAPEPGQDLLPPGIAIH